MYLLCSLKGRWHFLLQTITRISFFSPQTTTLTSFPILKFRCQFTLSIPALSKSTVELDAKVRQITKLPLTNMLSFYICLYKNTLIFYAGNQHKMYFKMKLMSFFKKKKHLRLLSHDVAIYSLHIFFHLLKGWFGQRG